MARPHYFTDEEKIELLSNPYTARISGCRVKFTLAFKQLVMENIGKPGMTHAKIFSLAGYRREIFTSYARRSMIISVCKEAHSPEGLREPRPAKQYCPRKKHSETEFKELQERVTLLEQQIDFLKKSQLLKKSKTSRQPTSSS